MLPGRAELALLNKQQLLELLLIVAKERDQLLEHKRADAAREAASSKEPEFKPQPKPEKLDDLAPAAEMGDKVHSFNFIAQASIIWQRACCCIGLTKAFSFFFTRCSW